MGFRFHKYITSKMLLLNTPENVVINNDNNQTINTKKELPIFRVEEPLWDSGEVEWDVFDNDENRTTINNMFSTIHYN
jgi:hypothetical protein